MINRTALFLAALMVCAGCSGRFFQPAANWWSEGGRICAAQADGAGIEWRRAAPRSCAQALAEPDAGKQAG